MKFEDVLPALREGKKVRRKVWGWLQFIRFEPNDLLKLVDEEGHHVSLSIDLFETDWEIFRGKKKVKLRDITPKQFKEHRTKWFCDQYDCNDCPFRHIICMSDNESCRVNHKDLYSDKLLDQEVEIEEE